MTKTKAGAIQQVAPPTRISGFCREGHHAVCAGGVLGAVPSVAKRDGNGKILARHTTTTMKCACTTCHPNRPAQCLRCNYRSHEQGWIDPDELTCLDVEACRDRCATRQAANPLHGLLIEVIRDAETTRYQQRIGRMPKANETTITPKVAPKPKTGACHHCGATTGGGKFAPGHDAKLKGELSRAVFNDELRLPDRVTAAAELLARGWEKRTIPETVKPQAAHMLEQQGPDKLIESANARRSKRHTESA